ncbi:MAG: LysR family transcriptional regulator [Rhodospirillum sp.]|nr:LysR family transcriptional regulator [Rhodospirillum sp.]
MARDLDWTLIKVFLAVSRLGGLSAAAVELGLDQSTVSRRIAQLEGRVGHRLFERHARGVRPTAAALDLRDQAAAMERAARSLDDYLTGRDSEMAGPVRVSATDGLASAWLVPRLAPFLERYPATRVDLAIEHRVADLSAGEADIALRLFRPKGEDLACEPVGVLRFGLFAAPRYLDIHGTPETEAALADHRLVVQGGMEALSGMRWLRGLLETHPRVVVRAESAGPYLAAARAGLGIGLLPLFHGKMFGESMVRLDIPVPDQQEVWLVAHRPTLKRARARTLWNHIREWAARDRLDWFA